MKARASAPSPALVVLVATVALLVPGLTTGAVAEPPPVGSACTITGTSGPNTLTGTSGSDVICGLGGDDTINALGGDDLVLGGTGVDTIDGGDGGDNLLGGDGDDVITGGNGNDEISGQVGADTVDGGVGIDAVLGGVGNDVVRGGPDLDKVYGEAGDDELHGDGGDDRTFGGTGNDDHFGGLGRDIMNDRDGSAFSDHVSCGDGDLEYAYIDFYDVVESDCERPRVLDVEDPVANNDVRTLDEDVPATTVPVLGNDTDFDGGPIKITAVTQPDHGTVVRFDRRVTYKPDLNYCNQVPPATPKDVFGYTLSPGGDTATVTVTVRCLDDGPVAVNDNATVAQDDPATTVDVLGNDTDVDGGPQAVSAVTQPANGSVAITNDGADLTYQPNAGYCNDSAPTDDFTYTLAPGGDTGTVAVTVTCASDDPAVAADDTATVTEDDPATTIDVRANDDPGDHGPISIDAVTQPDHGTVVITNAGADLTYAPDAGYCNDGSPTDDFTYTLTPDGDTATVAVTVTCANDPAVAADDTATLTEDDPAATIDVVANDDPGDHAPLTVDAVTQPDHGTVIITNAGADLTYEPDADYCNAPPATTLDSFSYDLQGGDSGTVEVTVTCENDAPVIAAIEGPALAYTEGDGAAVVTATGTVADVDSADLVGGTLTVNLSVGGHADDRLAIRNEGTGPGQIGVSGPDVTFGGAPLGAAAGGTGITPLVISLDGAATPQAVEALLRNVTYRHVGDSPAAARTVRFVLTDGDGGTSDAATRAVAITPANDAPVIAAIEGTALAYPENAAATVVTATGTVADVDSGNFDTGSLTVDLSAGGDADDRLEIRNEGTGTGQIGISGSNVTYGGSVTFGSFTGGTGTTPLVITLNSFATLSRTEALLRNITFRHVGDNPAASRTIRFALTDGDGGTSNPGTRVVALAAVNDLPVLAAFEGGALAYAENAAGTVITATGTIADVDSSNYDTGTLTVDLSAGGLAEDRLEIRNQGTGTQQIGVSGNTITYGGSVTFGSFTGGTGTTPLVITLNSFATQSRTQALLRNITYRNVSDNPTLTNRTVRFVLTDGDGGTSNAATRVVSLTGSNDVPVIAAMEGTATHYAENAAALLLTATAAVTDADSADFNTGTLTVDLSQNGTADDRLEIRNQGTGPGQIGVSGNTVTRSGVQIGTFTGGVGTTPLVITLDADATPAITTVLLRNLTFRNVSENPNTATRTVRFVQTDGDGGTSVAVTRGVTVGAVNDAPTTADPSAATTYTEQNGTASLVAPGLTIADVDDANMESATVTITSPVAGDTLTFTNQNGIGGSFASGVLTLTGSATKAHYETALRSVGFRNTTSDAPGTTRAFTVRVNDGTVQSNGLGRTITVVPVNDAPVVNLDASGALAYSEGAGFVNLVGPNATVTDPDSATLTSLTVTISAGYEQTFDTLRVDPPVSGVTVTFGAGLLTISKTGGTLAEYQTALRNVQFRNTDDDPDNRNDGTPNPTDATRTTSFVANDGALASTAVTRGITIAGVNDAPNVPTVKPTVAGVRNTTLASNFSVTGPHSVRTVNLVSNAVDPDGLESAITAVPVTNAATAQGGRITLTGTGLRYEPPASVSLTSDTYNYMLTDGTTASGSTLFTVNLSGAVWYAADGATAPMDGTAARPFDTVAAALAAAGTGTPVHVSRGTGDGTLSGPVALAAGDKLIGSRLALTHTAVGSTTAETLFPAGTAPILTAASGVDVITLAANVDVGGVDVDANGAANAISGSNVPGVVLRSTSVVAGVAETQPSVELTGTGNGVSFVEPVSLSSTAGGALVASNTAFSGAVTSISVTGGTSGPGVNLISTTGSLTLKDADIVTNGHTAFALSNAAGITVQAGTIAATGRPGVSATGLTAGTSLTFTEVDSTNSTTSGVILDGDPVDAGWGFSAGAGSLIQGATGNAFDLNNGSGTVSYAGSITTPASAKAVEVTGRAGGSTTFSGPISGAGIVVIGNSGGTVTFSGATKTINAGATIGVNLTSNTGSTVVFSNGGLAITTTTAVALVANAGGTVEITGPNNTIQTTTGTGVNITSTTIGSSGVTFRSISVDGAVHGILLNNPGKTGAFTVTGTGSSGSAGVIANTTNAGVSLTNTGPVSLTGLRITGSNRSGVQGTGVSGFTFTSGEIIDAGDLNNSADYAAIAFNGVAGGPNNVDGVVSITGNVITNPYGDAIDIRNYAGTISNATISGNTISTETTNVESQGSGISLRLLGTATSVASLTKATIQSNNMSGLPSGDGIIVEGGNTATATAPAGSYGTPGSLTDVVTIMSNLITGNASNKMAGSGIVVRVLGRGQGNFAISGNGSSASPLTNMITSGISLRVTGDATAYFLVNNNRVTPNNPIYGTGIELTTDQATQDNAAVLSTPTVRATINANTVANTGGSHISVLQADSNGTLNLRMVGNITSGIVSARSAIVVENGNSGNVAFNPTICASLSGNQAQTRPADGTGYKAPGISLYKLSAFTGIYPFGIVGVAPATPTNAQAEAHLAGLNPSSDAGAGPANVAGKKAVVGEDGFQSCTLPAGMA